MAIYNGKHCVFEQVGADSNWDIWNTTTNVDSDNAYNDWNISDIRNTHLPAFLLLLSNDLQSIIANTTVQTAKNGNNGTLISTSDKLFFPAEKEMTASPSLARSEENSALITWNYWTTHTTSTDRIKYDSTSTARWYWLRSPRSGYTGDVVIVQSEGNFMGYVPYNAVRLSVCFAI